MNLKKKRKKEKETFHLSDFQEQFYFTIQNFPKSTCLISILLSPGRVCIERKKKKNGRYNIIALMKFENLD